MWRHLKLLKRGVHGHASSGVEGTGRGELAIVCPACPIPGVNLLEGWRDDLSKQYVVFSKQSNNVSLLTVNLLALQIFVHKDNITGCKFPPEPSR
jgi:hypothetical protein